MEGSEGAVSRIWGLRLCPVLAPREELQLPQIPPQNEHLAPQSCQFRANPSQTLHLPKGFWGTPPEGRGGGVDGPGFIPGDFSKASGINTSLLPGRGKREFFFCVERGQLAVKCN